MPFCPCFFVLTSHFRNAKINLKTNKERNTYANN